MAPLPFEVRLAAAVRSAGAPHNTLLKDYALSYILAGIYSLSESRRVLAFKGGTALRKCYFPAYRFSEDLDFTMLEYWDDDRLHAALRTASEKAAGLAANGGRFTFAVDRLEHRDPHPFRQVDFRIRVDFPTGASLSIKAEVTRDEPVMRPAMVLPLIHVFESERLTEEITCYSLEEIALEKIRAFLQARRYLKNRDWLNRSRDLYDLWYLHTQTKHRIDWATLRQDLRKKAAAREAEFSGPDDFRDPKVLDLYERQWRPRLEDFVKDLPQFSVAKAEFDRILDEVFSGSTRG